MQPVTSSYSLLRSPFLRLPALLDVVVVLVTHIQNESRPFADGGRVVRVRQH